ncbi:MAG: ribbon-helix-helix domain-containing protein [Myxacorys chilensis ATA2-1-KO14]|nr:ribbon-helix-helix domain-containing protein [Myxacorys chilensis ATA2-1-KO14]
MDSGIRQVNHPSFTPVASLLEVYLPVRISGEDAAVLDEAVKDRGSNRSQVIRELIRSIPRSEIG